MLLVRYFVLFLVAVAMSILPFTVFESRSEAQGFFQDESIEQGDKGKADDSSPEKKVKKPNKKKAKKRNAKNKDKKSVKKKSAKKKKGSDTDNP